MKKIGSKLVYLLFLTFFLPMLPPSCMDMSPNYNNRKTETSPAEETATIDTTVIDSSLAIKDSGFIIKVSGAYDSSRITKTNENDIISDKESDQSRQEDMYMSTKRMSAITYLLSFLVFEYYFTFFSVFIVLVIILQRLFKRQWVTFKEKYLLSVGLLLFTTIGITHYHDLLWGYWIMLFTYLVVVIESWISSQANAEQRI